MAFGIGDVQTKDIWKAILGDLQLQVASPIYETWLRDTEGLALTDNQLTVSVPTPFAIEWLERRVYHLIQRTAEKVTGRLLDVQFQVGGTNLAGGTELDSRSGQLTSKSAPQSERHALKPKYTFSNFVVGPSNRLPYSAALAVAESPGQSYNPLFIYSGVGLGKTHLLHAIGHMSVAQGQRFMYVTCEQFTNDFIGAIRSRTTEEFRAKYRGVDMLLIDDIQFISGKEQTQEGFFHTFNDLHNANRQVVLTSDHPPEALSLLEDRLRSRFEWGLIADIQPPDLETRMAILRAKAEQMRVRLDDTIIEYVAKKVQKNVRELEGSLNRIAALSRMRDNPVTLELASQAISNFTPDRFRRSIGTEKVLEEVAKRFGLTNEHLAGASRRKEIVRARHVAMYLLHEELAMKDTDIGRLLGGRDHSTVIHAVGKVNYEVNVDPQLRQDLVALKEIIFT